MIFITDKILTFLGTKLEKRLARGDEGINPLDAACKQHDIAYQAKDTESRYSADKSLQSAAMKRIFAKNASLGERATALGVAIAMKAKRSLTKRGKGLGKKKPKTKSGLKRAKKQSSKRKTKQISFNTLIKNARVAIKKSKPETVEAAVQMAVDSVKRSKMGKSVKKPRIIKIPSHSGGVLPLVPIFAGLGALGSLIGGTSNIISAINQYRNATKQLEENKRHNREMESVAIVKGSGFYLHPYKTGRGFFLAPYPKNR